MSFPALRRLPALCRRHLFIIALTLLAVRPSPFCLAEETAVVRHDGKTARSIGQAVVTAADGGVMLKTPDGKLWNITPEELVSHSEDDKPFVPFTAEQLKKQILEELPPGFDSVKTAHYLVFYNTSRGYALWCRALFERLYTAFISFWTHRGFKLHEPETPLIVVIYSDQKTYAKQSTDELQDAAKRVIGFYSLQTNRVKTYDLTGAESVRQPGDNKRMDVRKLTNCSRFPMPVQWSPRSFTRPLTKLPSIWTATTLRLIHSGCPKAWQCISKRPI